MNKLFLLLFAILLSLISVSAQPISREYYNMEEKHVEIGDTFEIRNRGIFTVEHESGMLVEVGVARPTGEKIDCSEYTELSGSCGLVGFDVISDVFSGQGSSSVRPGENGMMSTPFFDIVALEVKNNEKYTDAVYTLKLVENKPFLLYVSANKNFTLLPNQVAKRGVYEIQNLGIGDDGKIYLYFTKNGERYVPSQELFSDGGYLPKMIMGEYWEKAYMNKPLTCLEPELCLFYYSSNTLDYSPKNDYSIAIMGSEMTLALMEMKIESPMIPENTSIKNIEDELQEEEPEQIDLIHEIDGNEIETENDSSQDLTAENYTNPETKQTESNPIRIAPLEGLEHENRGMFKSIGNFLKSLFGNKN